MKNILIVGPPRSGKTTLSKIIFNQYNVYSIINMDVIRDGIYEAFFCDIEKSTRKEIVTNAVPKFIKKIIEHYQKYYNPDMYYIIEGDILSIEDAIEIRNQYEVDIIYVGMPNIKEIDLFNRIRENASKYGCWTSKCSDIELSVEKIPAGAGGRNVIILVPKVGIEPTFPREHDFESCASANSATPATATRVYLNLY